MDRTLKAVMMGFGLIVGFYLTLLTARMAWFLALLLLPFLLVAAGIYLVGYGAPNLGAYGRKIHKAAETKARDALDWLDFQAPTWLWPTIRSARTFLDWLGLQVDA